MRLSPQSKPDVGSMQLQGRGQVSPLPAHPMTPIPSTARVAALPPNNLDFNQEIAHPFSAPLTGVLKRKASKARLCTGANRAGPAPQPVHAPGHLTTTKWVKPESLLTPKAPQNTLGKVPVPQPLKLRTIYEPRELKYSTSLTERGWLRAAWPPVPTLYTPTLQNLPKPLAPMGSSENLLKQLGCPCVGKVRESDYPSTHSEVASEFNTHGTGYTLPCSHSSTQGARAKGTGGGRGYARMVLRDE